MQSIKKRIKGQWLSMSFLILSVGIYAYGWFSTPNTYFFERRITFQLDRAQEILQEEIKIIHNRLEAAPKDFPPMELPINAEIKRIGASLYVIEDGELIYWSDSPILDAQALMQLENELSLQFLENGFYLTKRQIIQGRTYVSLQLLRSQYHYQNRYLKNLYHPYWEIPENIKLIPTAEQGIKIQPKSSSTPLFSLLGDTSYAMIAYNWWSFWALVCAAVVFFYGRFRKRLKKPKYLYLWTAFWLSLRYGFLWLGFPCTDGMKLFDPALCSLSRWNYTLGEVLIGTLVIIWIAIPWLKYLMRRTVAKRIKDSTRSIFSAIIATVVMQIFLLWIVLLSVHFVLDSTFEMVPHKVLNLSQYSLLAYGILSFLFFVVVVMEYVFAHIFPLFKRPYLLVVRFLFAVGVLFLYRETGGVFFVASLVFVLVSIIMSYRKLFFKIGVYLGIGLVSLLMVFIIIKTSVEKERYLSVNIAKRLSNERDPVLEYRMMQLSKAFKMDAKLWLEDQVSEEDLVDSLRVRHFSTDPFSSYHISFTVCGEKEHLIIADSKQQVTCSEFFRNRIRDDSKQVGESCFWFIPNAESNAEYLAVIPHFQPNTKDSVYLFVEFYKKDNYEKLGYPELLFNQDQDGWKQFNNLGFSYALYRGGNLLRSFGDYTYSRRGLYPQKKVASMDYHIHRQGHNHQFFYEKNDQLIIVSYPEITMVEIIFSFAYAYIFFFLSFGLLWYIFDLQRFTRSGLEKRIRVMLVIWITILLIGVSIVSINFNRSAYANQNETRGRSKMKALVSSYNRTFGNSPLKEIDPVLLNQWTVSLSNFIQADINLYGINGDFIGTSRKEALGKGFIGNKMNPEVFKVMLDYLPQRWVQKERIGDLSFLGIYAPLVDEQGAHLGFANIPHFTDISELKKGLSRAIANYVNLYVLFFLLTLPLSKLISYTISMPLIRLRNKMSGFQLSSKKPEQIIYHGEDEVGVLVRAYNHMVVQLNASANRLASSEREAAWREMARQIAHEIKNPLTPMLLSIQHLMRMKANNTPGWMNQLDKVAHTLEEQIDILATTASAFSDFAQINETEYQEVDLRLLLESLIPLYDTYHNISLELSIPQNPVKLTANREQLKRVLVNFMNNAVESIGDNPTGRIQILVDLHGHECRVAIKDNGIGIPVENMNRLFQPYFTTKSTGTGLGLAISKRIIQNFGGEIFFHSEVGKGASFGFIMPIFT